MFGGRDRIAERRVHHDDAPGGRRREIDVVDADAGASDHPELLGAVEDFFGHLGGGPDRQPVVVLDRARQLFLVEAELDVGFDAAFLEDLHRGRGKLVGN